MQKPWTILKQEDPEIYALMERELVRQQNGIELIASENFASLAVIQSMANPFTNKYAEGLPHRRYYGGCEVVDEMEELAIERACKLFECQFANVQPHSGAQANLAVMKALLRPHDVTLGLDLQAGGHLSHGAKVNVSGHYYESHFYGVDPITESLDYDVILDLAKALKPKMIIAGASAYAKIIDFKTFRGICDEVGALLLCDVSHIAGLIVSGHHPSPIPYADVVTTTTHKTLRGPRGGLILWQDEKYSPLLNKGVFPGTQGGPLEHIIAAKAVAFKEAMQPEFHTYQKHILENAKAMASAFIDMGIPVVGGLTENHLLLLNLTDLNMSGKDLENRLQKSSITTNKNTIPKETRSPFVTSGLRLGTPSVTSRGMGTKEMQDIAKFIGKIAFASNEELEKICSDIKSEVIGLSQRFPIYPTWM